MLLLRSAARSESLTAPGAANARFGVFPLVERHHETRIRRNFRRRWHFWHHVGEPLPADKRGASVAGRLHISFAVHLTTQTPREELAYVSPELAEWDGPIPEP